LPRAPQAVQQGTSHPCAPILAAAMSSASMPREDHDEELLADACPQEVAPPRRGRGRIMKLAVCVTAGVASMALIASRGRGTLVAVAPTHGESQLFGQVECRACSGGQCDCSWVNEETCAPTANAGDCCWSCCCAPSNFQFQPSGQLVNSQFQGQLVNSQFQQPGESSAGMAQSGGCSLRVGQAVHVTGNSGRVYDGNVLSQANGGLFQVGILDKSYTVHSEYIAECGSPWWANFWGFWVPFFLIVLLIGALAGLAFYLWKKMKE